MTEQPHSLEPAIVRGRIEALNIFEVSEAELVVLDRGSPDSIYLSFAIFFASVAASFLVALMATEIPSQRTFTVFVVVTVVGFMAAFVLFGLWMRSRVSVRQVVRSIRARIVPEGERVENDGADGIA